jgi:hypothetical protein
MFNETALYDYKSKSVCKLENESPATLHIEKKQQCSKSSASI